MKMHHLTWRLVVKALFMNDAFPVNGMPVKLVEKAGMSKSQNKEEGATNNHVTETNNLGVCPNYCRNLSQNF